MDRRQECEIWGIHKRCTDNDACTHRYRSTHGHTHTHSYSSNNSGALCLCVSSCIPSPDLQFQRRVSGRCGKRRAAATALRLPTTHPPLTGPRCCRIVGKLGEWRIAVFLTMTMNDTLRCLNTVSVAGGRTEPQQVIHLCPFPSLTHTLTR